MIYTRQNTHTPAHTHPDTHTLTHTHTRTHTQVIGMGSNSEQQQQ